MAGIEIFANNVSTYLVDPILPTTTTIEVAGGAFPTLVNGNFTRAAITSGTAPGSVAGSVYEYIKVTAVNGSTLTVERGQEGSTALGWTAGSILYLTDTAASLSQFLQAGEGGLVASFNGRGGNVILLNTDVNGALGYVPASTVAPTISSPTFTGIPVAPTAPVGTDTTQLATCAFVLANGGGGGGSGTVKSVSFQGDGIIFDSAPCPPVTVTGNVYPTLLDEPANSFLAGPLSGDPVAPTWRAIGKADIAAVMAAPPAIGGTTPAAGTFSVLTADSLQLDALNNTPIGNTAPSTGAFTTLNALGPLTGAGFSNYLAAPPPIGKDTPNDGEFTTLQANGQVSGPGFDNYMASPPDIGADNPNNATFTNADILTVLTAQTATLQNGTITNTPDVPTDIANKRYVDAVASGLRPKDEAYVASKGNLTLHGNQTIDGVVVPQGSRVLVKDQTAPAENGIYVTANNDWTRATDMATWSQVPSAFVFVQFGDTQGGTGWVTNVPSTGTIDVTPIEWVQFSQNTTYTAGYGLLLSGTVFSIIDTFWKSPPAIGQVTPNDGNFSTLSADDTVSGQGFLDYFASPPVIGGNAANAATFTDLTITGTISGDAFTNTLSAPPPIGNLTPNTGAFTTLSATSTVSGAGFNAFMASPPPVGSAAPNTGQFTSLSVTTEINGAAVPLLFGAPPEIGDITPNTGAFTSLTASGVVSGLGFNNYLAAPPPIGVTNPNEGHFTSMDATTGTVATAPTAATDIANKAYVDGKTGGYAPLNSPAFTGVPTAPTAPGGTNTTQLATCEFVLANGGGVSPYNGTMQMDSTSNPGTVNQYARGDHAHPSDTSRAPLVSPEFTGTPTAPTAAQGTNTQQLATCAFVQANKGGGFEPGTRVPFYQASAPVGWTSVIAAGELGLMMAVPLGSAGGKAGADDPTTCSVVAAHTHTFTTGATSVEHTHGVTGSTAAATAPHTHTQGGTVSGTTGGSSVDHTHGFSGSGNTGDQSADHQHGLSAGNSISTTGLNHSHGDVYTPGGGSNLYPTGASQTNRNGNSGGMSNSADHSHSLGGLTQGMNAGHHHGFSISGTTAGASGTNHSHSFSGSLGGNTGNADVSHSHTISFTSGAASATAHTHGGTTETNAATSWTPVRYNVLICSKD